MRTWQKLDLWSPLSSSSTSSAKTVPIYKFMQLEMMSRHSKMGNEIVRIRVEKFKVLFPLTYRTFIMLIQIQIYICFLPQYEKGMSMKFHFTFTADLFPCIHYEWIRTIRNICYCLKWFTMRRRKMVFFLSRFGWITPEIVFLRKSATNDIINALHAIELYKKFRKPLNLISSFRVWNTKWSNWKRELFDLSDLQFVMVW